MNYEAAVLGAILSTGKPYWQVADIVTADDFGEALHRDLFDAISQVSKSGVPADAVTIGERFPRLADLAFDLLASDGWTSANIRSYAEAVADRAVWRRVQGAGRAIAALGPNDAYSEAQRLLNATAPRSVGRGVHIREALRTSVEELQQRLQADDDITGVPSGIAELDEMTCGWQPGDMIALGARPSVGKTAFAIQLALAAARKCTVQFFSLEMSREQVADRMLAHLGQLDHSLIRRPKLMESWDWPKYTAAGAELNAMPIFVDDTPSLTVEAMAAKARQRDATDRLGLIVIDYLSYMAQPKANSTNDAIQIMTRSIKATAKQMKVPILLLCQLNRGDTGRPTLKSLRDSGSIEQDSDVVLFLHPQEERSSNIELIVAKQRNGPCGMLQMRADYKLQRFDREDFPMPEQAEERPARGFARMARRSA